MSVDADRLKKIRARWEGDKKITSDDVRWLLASLATELAREQRDQARRLSHVTGGLADLADRLKGFQS